MKQGNVREGLGRSRKVIEEVNRGTLQGLVYRPIVLCGALWP